MKASKLHKAFLNHFLGIRFFKTYVGLGFTDCNPEEKDINNMTQTVFYSTDLMQSHMGRMEHEFEKESVNHMARETLRRFNARYDGAGQVDQPYMLHLRIGQGHAYSKYNTLMHFLNVVKTYWRNPDLGNVALCGKDVRTLLALASQKIFFAPNHQGWYHYGPFEHAAGGGGYYSSYGTSRGELDLAVASSLRNAAPGPTRRAARKHLELVVADRVYEYHYLQKILRNVFDAAGGEPFKSDNEVLNLCLLSLLLDFGLFEEYADLLRLPLLARRLQHRADTRELQVEVANLIYEFDRGNVAEDVARNKVEELLFETSHKFLVNKDVSLQSAQFKLIRALNSDPDYQSYVLLVKIYMSLCQINKSVEVDYYKVHCDGGFRIIIPNSFSQRTCEYLEEVTKRYTFSEKEGIMTYDDLPVFDLRPQQPDIDLYGIRLESGSNVQSMVKYVKIDNAFRIMSSAEKYLVFVADSTLVVEVANRGRTSVRINNIPAEVACLFCNEALSFLPAFKYADGEDVVVFASPNMHLHVDGGGQFHPDYYGMRHELVELVSSVEVGVDLNDEHVFKRQRLNDLLTESKTVLHYPDYLLQVPRRSELINLLDLAMRLRNVSFFILVLLYLQRASIHLVYHTTNREGKLQITGPWLEAICYVIQAEENGKKNKHYDAIFSKQFFDLNQHRDLPLDRFIDRLCQNFTKYQRFVDGRYRIIPTDKQKAFLTRLITAQECFHFSEVGSGKTKVILPLLCQIFLSNNAEAHSHLARGGAPKDVLVVLVPEHLVTDACAQVYRYCLNLNFRDTYFVHDEIVALKSPRVDLGKGHKRIFVTSFNQFKKALTDDEICEKVFPRREHFLLVADEVDDFLDRNKLVFNICSNKNNAFDRSTRDLYFDVSSAAYRGVDCPATVRGAENPRYWTQLYEKFCAIHAEIQDVSRSINKNFGIFNAHTLRHCSTNTAYDIEGYKSLIARPYESVNRAMPGSYYSDVERTLFLTYVILSEDVAKYDALFAMERKFITYEYWHAHFLHQLDFDDLVYGHEKLSEICDKHPEARQGLVQFLYEIILNKMEIRDKSRSVNSIDLVFNFDCIGFTGTPFLENYPAANYIRNKRTDDIPDMINREFYVYSSDHLRQTEFEDRFKRFQGQNDHVLVKYLSSDFVRSSPNEMATLQSIFTKEEESREAEAMATARDVDGNTGPSGFNTIVDLCGIFKLSTIQDVRTLIQAHFGPDRFHYLYHIDQSDNSDRVLCMKTGNDIQYDEEFYKHLCNEYAAELRQRIFFFVDNRNVIGKDIPFQLVYQRQYGQALFTKSIVLAHDVDDFSKIWQAMGRSRTMNQTEFSIYKSNIPATCETEGRAQDIKKQPLTRQLYITNCDRKMAGNISSIYLTLIALLNLSQRKFYYQDDIVNTFLEKMKQTIEKNVVLHERQLVHHILRTSELASIFQNILTDKFRRSATPDVANLVLDEARLDQLLRHITKQKYEQRPPSRDLFDHLILFLSGEQKSLMEISYTKQHQKQKQKQQNKNRDSDAMSTFNKHHQLPMCKATTDYFVSTKSLKTDWPKRALAMVVPIPVLSLSYTIGGRRGAINVYPTVQFLYSHHIHEEYIVEKVRSTLDSYTLESFIRDVKRRHHMSSSTDHASRMVENGRDGSYCTSISINYVRQNPQYTIAALEEGIYIIGMKDQFNVFDLPTNPLCKFIQCVTDEFGFVLYDRTGCKDIDQLGPYFIEQYIIMEVLAKQEIAENVIEYYLKHKGKLQKGLSRYNEKQGQGFICWRFLLNDASKTIAKTIDGSIDEMDIDETIIKRKRTKQ
uniref:Uncharacterized protein n=1 Tax=Corethron hystrix TaxID=216773 RepID=A0A7S1C0Z4_9STRA